MDLAARHAQVLQDQIRHGFATRQPYGAADDVRAGRRRSGSWLDREDHASALEQIARQDRIRIRAFCAALRALVEDQVTRAPRIAGRRMIAIFGLTIISRR